jgi:hypothetical protein
MPDTRVVFINAIIQPLTFILENASDIDAVEYTLKYVLTLNGWSINWLNIGVANASQVNLAISANVQTQFNQSEIRSYLTSQLADYLRVTWIDSFDQVIQTTQTTQPPAQPPPVRPPTVQPPVRPPVQQQQQQSPVVPTAASLDIFSQIGNLTGLTKVGLSAKTSGVLAMGLLLVIAVKTVQK